MDLGFTRPIYTWYNKQDSPYGIQARLDRALANSDWLAENNNATLTHLPPNRLRPLPYIP